MRIVFKIFLLFSVIACSKNKGLDRQKLMVFPESFNLKGLTVKEITPLSPSFIIVQDSLLAILNSQSEPVFQIYDAKSLVLLSEFGERGDGPQEFIGPLFTGLTSEVDGNKFQMIYETEKKKMAFLNLYDSVNNSISNFNFVKLTEIDDFNHSAQNVIYHSDSLTIISSMDDRGQLGRFSMLRNGKEQHVGYLPKISIDMRPDQLYSIYANIASTSNVHKRRFVATNLYFGQYDFFDFNGNYIKSSTFNDENDVAGIVKEIDDLRKLVPSPILHINVLKSYNEIIYSLYSPIDIRGNSLGNSLIHVLDWDGNPIRKYVLDRQISNFAFDQINNCFYGIDPNVEDFQIIKYEL